MLMAKPLLALSWLARPVVWFLTVSSNVILKPFRDRTTFLEARISKEEIQQMVEEAAETGALHEHASEIASRALEFDKLSLSDVMVPRNSMDALPINAKPDQVRRFLLEERRSRIPVYDRSLDDILGDPYVTNRATPDQVKRVLERPEVIHAIGDDMIAAHASKL
jgi:putative hemolysin